MSDNASVLRAFIERVWNAGDLAAVDAFLAPAYTIHSDPGDPWDGQTLDREGFKRRLAASRAPFPDTSFEIHDLVAEGDRVVMSWTLHGTHRAPLGELPATGRKIAVKGMTIYDFAEGRISGHTQVVDRLAVLQQLDLLRLP